MNNLESNHAVTPYPEQYNPIPEFPGRQITIEPLNKGYVVKVGCQTVAIENKDRLIDLLTRYLRNPQEI
jgi:hypothetical protein